MVRERYTFCFYFISPKVRALLYGFCYTDGAGVVVDFTGHSNDFPGNNTKNKITGGFDKNG